MKNILIFIISILNFTVYAQQWEWAKNFTYNSNNPIGSCLASDNNSNFYVSSNFNLSSSSCIAKFDGQGNELWRQYLSGDVAINGITWFPNYVCITGSFTNSFQIGTTTLISQGLHDVFTACYTSNGNFVWANSYGGSQDDYGNGICSNTSGNIYLTGAYSGTANFGTSNLVCQGTSNMFMAKINSSGNILLLKSASSQDSTVGSSGSKIKTDILGNIFILGDFKDIVLDTMHVVGDNYYGSNFLCKIDAIGNTQWVKEVINGTEHLYDIALDQTGNIISTGGGNGWHQGFTITKKYNSSGQFLWEKNIGGNLYDDYTSNAIATDGINSFIVGDAEVPYNYFLLAKYDSLGALIYLDTIKALASGKSIIRDSNGDYIISGIMQGSLTFGNDLLSTSASTIFIAKFHESNLTNVIQNIRPLQEINIYPNPSFGLFTVSLKNNTVETKICVYDVIGNCLLNKDCRNDISPKIDLSSQPKGVYFLEIWSDGERAMKKIVLQ